MLSTVVELNPATLNADSGEIGQSQSLLITPLWSQGAHDEEENPNLFSAEHHSLVKILRNPDMNTDA